MVCVCRGIQGLTQGGVFPALHYSISKWAPLDEKSRVTSFIFAGESERLFLLAAGSLENIHA